MITLYHGSYIQVGKPLVKLGTKVSQVNKYQLACL